jgi:hypothetical protein
VGGRFLSGHPGDVLVAFVTLLLVVVTMASIVATWKISKSQEALQTRLAEEQKELQERLSSDHAALQARISQETRERHEEQRRFEQRAQLIPLWEYMSSLREIIPDNPITPQVVKTVNTLELIALCKEADIVDGTVVLRTFRQKYIELFETVSECGPLKGYPGDKKPTGKDLLAENHAATQLYNDLIAERNNRDKPPL